MKDGYIKLHRICLNNDLFDVKPYDDWRAWEYLLLNACFTDKSLLRNGKIIELKSGQFLTSYRFLGVAFGWSVNKVRRYLSNLHQLGMISFINDKNGTLITVENYTKYQGNYGSVNTQTNTPMNTQTDTQTNTKNKKEKKVKNKKYISNDIYKEVPAELLDAFKEYGAMREFIKKPLTDNMVKRKLNRLDKLADCVEDKIAIILCATEHYWLDFYKAEQEDKKKTTAGGIDWENV